MLSSLAFLIRCELKAIRNEINKWAKFPPLSNRRHLLVIMTRKSHLLISSRIHRLSLVLKDNITSADSMPNVDDLKHKAVNRIVSGNSINKVAQITEISILRHGLTNPSSICTSQTYPKQTFLLALPLVYSQMKERSWMEWQWSWCGFYMCYTKLFEGFFSQVSAWFRFYIFVGLTEIRHKHCLKWEDVSCKDFLLTQEES